MLPQSTEKNLSTKIIAIFFPLKPLKNKFSDNFISIQIADFIPKIKEFTTKSIIYKIDKERFFTFDFEKDKFDETIDVVDNQTIVIIFSVSKDININIEDYFDSEFSNNINTIRVHRKKLEAVNKNAKPSYIFYTINSTRLLNNIISLLETPDPAEKEKEENEKSKTYFILGANNAKRNLDPIKKSFSTEKICRMNYISTVDLTDLKTVSEEFLKGLKRKIQNSIE